MSTNCDVVIPYSPPPSVFRHNKNSNDVISSDSHAASAFYPPYGNCRFQSFPPPSPTPSLSKFSTNGSRRHASPLRIALVCNFNQERKPPRPCLVTRPPPSDDVNSSGSGDENEPSSPTRQKKKVVFADDRGFSLTQVKMMVEPVYDAPFGFTHFPSYVSRASVNGTDVRPSPWARSTPVPARTTNAAGKWKTMFSQPASNYLDFRRKLEADDVSLENVIIKQNGAENNEIVGTVKVKNICYEKIVFVRITTDDWTTYEDVTCTFVGNNNTSNSGSSVLIIYDTFSFKVSLPTFSEKNLEFCVCFKTPHEEFWDNNGGKNYKVVKNSEANIASKDPVHRSDPWSTFGRWIDDTIHMEHSYY